MSFAFSFSFLCVLCARPLGLPPSPRRGQAGIRCLFGKLDSAVNLPYNCIDVSMPA